MNEATPLTAPLRAVLFDLDGTLLQVEMQQFIPLYLQDLSSYFAPEIDQVRLQQTMRAAIAALLQPRQGNATNRELFLLALERHLQLPPQQFEHQWQRWFDDRGELLKELTAPHPLTRALVQMVQQCGCKLVIATNPVFPRSLIDARLRWAGLDNCQFDLVTSYENSCHCKPNRGYFTDILQQLQLPAAEVLMVGNDNHHDTAATKAGIPTFLVDTWLIDRSPDSYPADFRGDHQQLLQFLQQRLG